MNKKEKKKLVILKAGERLFEKKGYKGVSVDDIVKKAGIAKGTFYLYYQSKDELYTSLVLSYKDVGEERMKVVLSEEPDVRVRLLRAFMGRLKLISVKPILKGIFLEDVQYFSPTITLHEIFRINEEMTTNILGKSSVFRPEVNSHFLAEIHWFFSTLIRYKDWHCHSEDLYWEHAELLAKVIIDGLFSKADWPKVNWESHWKKLLESMSAKN